MSGAGGLGFKRVSGLEGRVYMKFRAAIQCSGLPSRDDRGLGLVRCIGLDIEIRVGGAVFKVSGEME